MQYGIDMSLKDIQGEARCQEVFDKYLPGMRQMLSSQPMTGSLSIRKIAQYSGGKIPESALKALDEALQQFNDGSLSPSEKKKVALYQSMAEEDRRRSVSDKMAADAQAPQFQPGQAVAGTTTGTRANAGVSVTAAQPEADISASTSDGAAFHPGQVWLDTNGHPIQAHGGQVICVDGTWYWYGENKEHTDGHSDIWSWGIRCYQSADLYHWKDLGLIIEPDLEHPDASLFPDKHLDRPHIVRSQASGRFACWIKLSGISASYIVLEADAITGPYHIVRENYRPFDFEVGDFDLYTDKKSGKTYLFETGNHNGIYGMELSPNCTEAVRLVSRQYENMIPPFTREGVTLFDAGGRYYMITSGMTGYLPNQSDCAVTDDIEKPFQPVGDPHGEDVTKTSFHSQLSQVFHTNITGKDQLVSVADRWVVDPILDAKTEDMLVRVIASTNDPEKYKVTDEEKKTIMSMTAMDDTKVNTSLSRYVWLPVEIQNGKAVIRWHDTWQLA